MWGMIYIYLSRTVLKNLENKIEKKFICDAFLPSGLLPSGFDDVVCDYTCALKRDADSLKRFWKNFLNKFLQTNQIHLYHFFFGQIDR